MQIARMLLLKISMLCILCVPLVAVGQAPTIQAIRNSSDPLFMRVSGRNLALSPEDPDYLSERPFQDEPLYKSFDSSNQFPWTEQSAVNAYQNYVTAQYAWSNVGD
jgi:hypothetical protein